MNRRRHKKNESSKFASIEQLRLDLYEVVDHELFHNDTICVNCSDYDNGTSIVRYWLTQKIWADDTMFHINIYKKNRPNSRIKVEYINNRIHKIMTYK